MAELYRQVVLKEAKPELATGLQIQGLGKPKAQPQTAGEPTGETVTH